MILTVEKRYKIFENLFVGSETDGKRTMKSFISRKRANNFITLSGQNYNDVWLDSEGIPKYSWEFISQAEVDYRNNFWIRIYNPKK